MAVALYAVLYYMNVTASESARAGWIDRVASRDRARGALVAAAAALAVVLVAGAGLMLRSFERLTSVDTGFRPEGALLANFSVDFEAVPGESQAAGIGRRLEVGGCREG